jgi:hypothetical protein
MLDDREMRERVDRTLGLLELRLAQRRQRLKQRVATGAAAGLLAAINACAKPVYAGPDDVVLKYGVQLDAGMDAESCHACDSAYGMDRPRPDSRADAVDLPDAISERLSDAAYAMDRPLRDASRLDVEPADLISQDSTFDGGALDALPGRDLAYGIGF